MTFADENWEHPEDMDIKYMDLDEFREEGFLQEANRQFFHPHGLALEWRGRIEKADVAEWLGDDADELLEMFMDFLHDHKLDGPMLSGVWDYRDDPEGMVFADAVDRDKVQRVYAEYTKHYYKRAELFRSAVDRGVDTPVQPLEWAMPQVAEAPSDQLTFRRE